MTIAGRAEIQGTIHPESTVRPVEKQLGRLEDGWILK